MGTEFSRKQYPYRLKNCICFLTAETVGRIVGFSRQQSIASLQSSGYVLLLPKDGRRGLGRSVFISFIVSVKYQEKVGKTAFVYAQF